MKMDQVHETNSEFYVPAEQVRKLFFRHKHTNILSQ